jgi:hypothetical protein
MLTPTDFLERRFWTTRRKAEEASSRITHAQPTMSTKRRGLPPGSNAKQKPGQSPGDRLRKARTYRCAVKTGQIFVGLGPWPPPPLRLDDRTVVLYM